MPTPPPSPSIKLHATAWLIRGTLAALRSSYRFQIVSGSAHWSTFASGGAPLVISFWHEQVLVFASLFRRQLLRRGIPLTVFASLSKDGELGALLGQAWGAHVVRGSASRGGTAGLRGMYRAITQQRSSPIVIPDGPRGPSHVAKPGAVVLAQMAGVPILPLAAAPQRAWRLGSWDRMWVPQPLSRIGVAVGPPFEVPKQLQDGDVETWSRRLQETLDTLGEEARRGIG